MDIPMTQTKHQPLSVPNMLSEVVIRYTRDDEPHQIAVLVEPKELTEVDMNFLSRGVRKALRLAASDDVLSVCKVETSEIELL